jgi:hypothetical protein
MYWSILSRYTEWFSRRRPRINNYTSRNIVACLLKATIVEPTETTVAKELPFKRHASITAVAHATMEVPKSKSHYDRRPVGQCVLVSSPVWGSWPDVNSCLTVTVLSISGTPSDERSGLSFVLVTWTASVQYSTFAAGPRQHSISPYL